GSPAGLALGVAGAGQLPELGLELGRAPQQAAAVDLELGLARTPGADAARLLAERLAPTPKAREAIAQEGQLDLGLALLGVGVLGEDVEYHGGAVDRCPPQDLLEVAALG